MNAGVSIKNLMIGILVTMIICAIVVRAIGSIIRHVKLTNIQILKIAYAENVYLTDY